MHTLTVTKRFCLAGFLSVAVWAIGGATAEAHGHGGFGRSGFGGGHGSFGRSFGGGFGRSGFGGFSRGHGSFGRSFGGFSSGFGRSFGGFNSGFGRSFGGGFGRSYGGFGGGFGSYYSPYYSSYRGFGRYGGYGGYSSYRYRPSYSPIYRSVQAAPVVHTNAFVANPYPAPAVNQSGLDQGWSMLASGNNYSAMKIFGDFASTHTSAAEPKVGYALAATANGDAKTGAWAMRRAIAIDPNVVRDLTDKRSMQGTMSQLAGQLHESLKTNPNQPDTSFLLTTLDGAASNSMSPYEMKTDEMKAEEMGTDLVKMAKPAVGNVETQIETLPPGTKEVMETEKADMPAPPSPTLL